MAFHLEIKAIQPANSRLSTLNKNQGLTPPARPLNARIRVLIRRGGLAKLELGVGEDNAGGASGDAADGGTGDAVTLDGAANAIGVIGTDD